MNNMHAIAMILVAGLVTVFLRSAPFLLWGGEKKTPEFIVWLGNMLPYAIMAMLVVYCLRNTSLTEMSSLIPASAGVGVTAGIQAWKRNSVYSILAGTIVYMVLIQIM